jgi:hypothetical protein
VRQQAEEAMRREKQPAVAYELGLYENGKLKKMTQDSFHRFLVPAFFKKIFKTAI